MSTPEAPAPIITRDRLTSEDIAKINTALEASQGHHAAAAEILGMDKDRLSSAVQRIPALNARWALDKEVREGRTDINPTTALTRTPPQSLTLTEAQKTAIALSVGQKKMNRSLAKLGFKSTEIEAISSVEEFAGQHFDQTLNIMHGGLLKSAMRLMMLAERIESQYLQNEGLEERDRKYWWDTYFRILEKLRDFNEQTNKAALTKALIEMKKKESEAGKSGGKAGFQPLSANVQINVAAGGQDTIKVVAPNEPLDPTGS